MPSDLTGTATSLGIGTYNTSEDAPSGLGFNEAMAQIDALIAARMKVVGSPTDGQVPVWNATNGDWEPGDMSSGIGLPTITDETTSYTLVLGDANNVIRMNDASANTLTVPPNSSAAFPVGSSVTIIQLGAGQTTIAAGAGVTLDYTPGLKIAARYGAATLLKVATDEWSVFGNLTP